MLNKLNQANAAVEILNKCYKNPRVNVPIKASNDLEAEQLKGAVMGFLDVLDVHEITWRKLAGMYYITYRPDAYYK